MLSKDSKIYVAGHRGLVGSAIWNNLKQRGYNNLIGRTHAELDLTDQLAVRRFFDEERPDAVVLAAAFVGGIMANSLYRADFIMQNMLMQCNVIGEAYAHGVKRLLFLGSTCIYPKNAPQPMKEDVLLTSPLEYTNEEYAIAKIAGLKMCESYNLQYGTNYIAVMPTNLYGPNDNFHLENSHVMPAMMRKIYLAKLIHDENWEAICQRDCKYFSLSCVDLNVYRNDKGEDKGLIIDGTVSDDDAFFISNQRDADDWDEHSFNFEEDLDDAFVPKEDIIGKKLVDVVELIIDAIQDEYDRLYDIAEDKAIEEHHDRMNGRYDDD